MTKLEKLKKLLAYVERALAGRYGPLTNEDRSLLEVWKKDLTKEIEELKSEMDNEAPIDATKKTPSAQPTEPEPGSTSKLKRGSRP